MKTVKAYFIFRKGKNHTQDIPLCDDGSFMKTVVTFSREAKRNVTMKLFSVSNGVPTYTEVR